MNINEQDQKVAIVTGSSSGIGRETALILARNGYTTFATARNLEKTTDLKKISENEKIDLRPVELDVTKDESVNNAKDSILRETGRIDILVNNAGYGLVGAFEDSSIEEVKNQYETNFFGVIRTTQSVLPTMRKQKSGIIVNISSGVGRFGFPTGSAYASTKFALEGLSESMRYELEPFGIRVVIIEPGVIITNFVKSTVVAKKGMDPNSPYIQLVKSMETNFDKMLKNGSTPEYVAHVIFDAIRDKSPKLRYPAGKDVEQWLEAKKKMSDEEFYNMMKNL
jgi:NAD(P)-dependent dehydrogenase (short-subunit alcohol dehydrogenase family)